MSFSLLLPLYLAGAAAIAGPLIVHLRQRSTAQPYDFSTLRFLMKTQLISSRRRRLMRLLLLMLRVAVILALVFGFARLWLADPPELADKATVVVVDVSASMRGDSIWSETLKSARAAVDDAGTNTAVVTMGRWSRVARGFENSDRTAAEAISTLQPTYESGDAEAALRRAGELLEDAYAKDKKIVLVSDFARPEWSAVRWNQPLPAGITLEQHRVAESPTGNLAVVEVKTPRTFWEAKEPVAVEATIRHLPADLTAASGPAVSVDVHLTAGVNQNVVTEDRTISVPVNGQVTTQFIVEPQSLSDLSGEVRLTNADGQLPADDAAYFHVPAGELLRVGRLKHPDTDDTFLDMAVKPKLTNEAQANEKTAAQPYSILAYDPAKEFDALIIDHGLTFNDLVREGVETHLDAGRPLLVIVGQNARGRDSWESQTLGVAGGRQGQNRLTSSVLLAGGMASSGFGQIDLYHPILKPFAAPHSGDLFAVEVHRWRALDAPKLQPLIQMANGDTVMGVASVGGARVAALGLDLNREASTWPVESTFLPMIHQTLAWLTGRAEVTGDLLVGDRGINGEVYDRPGVFNGKVVTLDPNESDPRRYTVDTFDRLTPPKDPAQQPQAAASAAPAPPTGQDGNDITVWLLLLAAFAAATELWLGNRLSRG
ncbi:MAG: BatA domain-containing protein [Planctomycetota bacterium]